MSKALSIIPAVIKRATVVKQNMLANGIPDSLMNYNKLVLSKDLGAVIVYQKEVNNALETLAKKLQAAGVEEIVGDIQFSNMIENAKNAHSDPFPASVQSLARRQELTESGQVPAALWVQEKDGVVKGGIDLSEGLDLSDLD